MKCVKKFIIFMLCLVLSVGVITPNVFATNREVSISDGIEKLRAQFSRDKGPLTNGYAIDYSFFSPVKSNNDETKYPLVVIMAGALEGQYAGKELIANEFANWSSCEYQSRFVLSGGAYILIARAPEERFVCWDAAELTAPLKAALDDFIIKHPNVDTNRIYTIGWCLGAKGAINLTVNYPEFVDAAIIMVPPFTISDSTAQKLTQVPVWLVGCKNDSYARYNMYIEPTWRKLKTYASEPKKILLTSFDTAVNGNFFFNHNVWLQFSYDMYYPGDEYSGMKTINGDNEEIPNIFGCIKWLSFNGIDTLKFNFIENDDCSCLCHNPNPLIKTLWKLASIISILITPKGFRNCKCGLKHW